MTNDTSSESSYALLLESAKNCKLAIFFAKSCHKVTMFANKCRKNFKLYIFGKPLTMPFQICKNLCKIINLMCNLEN